MEKLLFSVVLISLILCLFTNSSFFISSIDPLPLIREKVTQLSIERKNQDIVLYLNQIEKDFGGKLPIDGIHPSLYSYKAVAHYDSQQINEAVSCLEIGVKESPKEVNLWKNLGEISVQIFRLNRSIEAYIKAAELGDYSASQRIIRSKGWGAYWKDFELYSSDIENQALLCEENLADCPLESTNGLEYSDISSRASRLVTIISPVAQKAFEYFPANLIAPLKRKSSQKKLKIGLISSDFGVHPVATLIRGFIEHLDKTKFDLYCFSLRPLTSWWGANIAEHSNFFILSGKNFHESAMFIAEHKIDILIDLNGHTMFSGLGILGFKPAPIQMSYLGLPTTTGSSYIDYYLGDYVALPPEIHEEFSEKLILGPPCYITNDYAQLQGSVSLINENYRASRSSLNTAEDLSKATLLIGTLSNSQKMDPIIFHVWMNILQRFAGSKMVIMEYSGKEDYIPNLRSFANFFGISSNRLVSSPQAPWIDHLYLKTSIDLILDTRVKNAHTTGLDGIWAGIPTITFAQGSTMSSRAGESIAKGMHHELGLAMSVKDYEDLAFRLLRTQYKQIFEKEKRTRKNKKVKKDTQSSKMPNTEEKGPKYTTEEVLTRSKAYSPLLNQWRKQLHYDILHSPLFDTPYFTRNTEHLLQASWDLTWLTQKKLNISENFHIFTSVSKDNEVREQYRLPNASTIPLDMVNLTESNKMSFDTEKTFTKEILPTYFPELLTNYLNDYEQQQLLNKTIPTKAISKTAKKPSFNDLTKFKISKTIEMFDWDELYDRKDDQENSKAGLALPHELFDGRLIMLNIGGLHKAKGWFTVNYYETFVNYTFKPDIRREMSDLYGIPNNSVSAIYSSHTLEHASFGDDMLFKTLKEWHRVLRPGGLLLISVPDLETLAKMYLDPELTIEERWKVTKMMFGAQSDVHDYHKVGLNYEILTNFLQSEKFCGIERVGHFNLAMENDRGVIMTDSSDIYYKNYFISLNVVARVCVDSKPNITYDGFDIQHHALPYQGPKVAKPLIANQEAFST